MTRVNNQLLKLMSILDEQAKLHPKGTAIQVKSELFIDCPDHAHLLDKLEKEHSVIIIEQRPDSKGYAQADHDMFSWEYPKDYERYMSYFIMLKPSFTAFYKAEYVKNRSSTSTLTDNNRQLVISVMQAIDDEVSLIGSTEISIDLVKTEAMTYEQREVATHKALDFLKKVGAVSSYEAIDEIGFNGEYERMMPTGQIDVFKVEIILPDFDEILSELKNSGKTVKEPARHSVSDAPIEYDDEHATATYKEKTEKLFDTSTIMSVLTHRVLNADGARINATDVLLEIESQRIDPDKDKTTKALTNAKDRINKRFERLFNTKDVICYERQQFWLNEKYCSEKSPYRLARSGN